MKTTLCTALLAVLAGTVRGSEESWLHRSLTWLSFPVISASLPGPDAHCLQFSAKNQTSLELHRISENGWKDMSENAYVQQSFLLTNNGTRDICAFEFYLPLTSEMRVYSSYSITLNRSSVISPNDPLGGTAYSFKGTFPPFQHRLARNETFTFGYILVGPRPAAESRTVARPVPCISGVRAC